MTPEQTRRWADLCSRAVQAGQLDVAADVVTTLVETAQISRLVVAGQAKTHQLDDDSGQFLRDLHEMLDETGFTNILRCSEQRIKALEQCKPSLLVDVTRIATSL